MRGFIETKPRRPQEARTGCGVVGCTNETNGRKPFCIDHLDQLPYVKQLRAELSRREAVSTIEFSSEVALNASRNAGRHSDQLRIPFGTAESMASRPKRVS